MTLATTSAFISTVDESRTIVLPDGIPIGAKVAVVLMPSEEGLTETQRARRARFEKVMAVIRTAMTEGFTPPDISDEELDARIERARKAAQV